LHSNTYMKGMLIWIFDWKGFILKHWLPWKQTWNGVSFADTLKICLGKNQWAAETRGLEMVV
jgi:hypothetical protein